MTSEPVVGDANTGERQDEPLALPVGGLLLQGSSNAYIYTESAAPAEQVNLSTGAISYLVTDAIGSVRGGGGR
jgi:hypothetical protein